MRLVTALLALAACGDNVPAVFEDPRTIEFRYPSEPNKDLDLLVVMDDTIGLSAVQADMATHLPEVLAQLSVFGGALPNLHIALTTSDMGTTGSDAPNGPGPSIGQIGNGGCVGLGKDGALLPPATGISFLADREENGIRFRNYQGELATVFGSLLRSPGSGGCGFEQHLRGMRRALTRPENAAFLRPAAALAVLIVADEDDCSLRSSRLLTTDTSELGALQSFRCTSEGVECNERLDELGLKSNCRPREDSAYVEGIASTIEFLEGLKPPGNLVVTGIIGDPEPFVVELRSPPGGGTAYPALGSVCSGALSGGVHPSPRLATLFSHFQGRGTSRSICGASTGPAMLEVARALKTMLGVVCLDTSRLTITSTDQGLQPACEITEIVGDVETRITDFTIAADAVACPETADHLRLVVRNASSVPGAYIRARCEASGVP